MSEDEITSRIEIAHLSYGEVLDATKHNDDKIGRSLTPIAFFTTAAIAFAVGGGDRVLRIRFEIGNYLTPLPAIFLILTLILIVLTVIIYLNAMGNPLTFPSRGMNTSEGLGSNLFFFEIAKTERADWLKTWGSKSERSLHEIQTATLDNLVSEAHNLARRVDFKYRRMEIARACLIASLITLTLALSTTFIVFFNGTKLDSNYSVLNWSLHNRMIFALTICAIETCLTLEAHLNARFRTKADPRLKDREHLYPWLYFLIPSFSIDLMFLNPSSGNELKKFAPIALAGIIAIGLYSVIHLIYVYDKAAHGEDTESHTRDDSDLGESESAISRSIHFLTVAALLVFAICAPLLLLPSRLTGAKAIWALIVATAPMFITQVNATETALRHSMK